MSAFLHTAKIIEGPSPSQFVLTAAEGGTAEFTLRLTLSENGEVVYEQWATLISFNNAKRSIYLDGMYTVQDGCWNVQYDPLRRSGHIVSVSDDCVGYDDVIAVRRAFFGTRLRRFITVRHAAWLR